MISAHMDAVHACKVSHTVLYRLAPYQKFATYTVNIEDFYECLMHMGANTHWLISSWACFLSSKAGKGAV